MTPTWAASAPFCGPKTGAASTKPVSTSHATRRVTSRSRSAPVERVDGSQAAVRRRRAADADDDAGGARLIAASISSPVPRVEARSGSLPALPPASARPEARAISMTATSPSRRHGASTGSPRGPETTCVRLPPPKTSRVASPPSASGSSVQVQPARRRAGRDRGGRLRPRSACRETCRAPRGGAPRQPM